MQNKNQENTEIDLLELFYVLLGRWKSIAISTVLVAACAYVISAFVLVPQYESTSVLYVLSKSTSITSLADVQMGTSLTSDYVEVVTSRPIIEQVIGNLGLDTDYKGMVGKISIVNPSNTRLLKITVEDPDPDMAKQIADEMADVSRAFISEKMDQAAPTVTQYGYADGKPSSPNITRNTVLGAFIGALLAIAVVVLSFLTNDTIVSGEDVEKKLGLTLLGSIPEDEKEYDGARRVRSKADKRTTARTNNKR